ncbi:MAG TPA: zf-HC2 domain-containing protein [Symbiobacteriaceae bacterium]|nr:zf-HC2 domain-containing protein [Symbiobacteriaceae bacterium]
MQCWQVIDSMPEFVADRLPTDQAAELEAHLATCESCWTAYLEAQDHDDLPFVDESLADPALVRLMTTEPPPLPQGWADQIVDQIDWAPPVSAPVRWWAKALRHPAVSGTYAAAAAILVFSVAQRVFLWQTTTNGLGALLLQGELWLAMLGDRFFEVGSWATNLLQNLF